MRYRTNATNPILITHAISHRLYPIPTSSSGYEYDDDDNSTLLANTSAMDVFDALTLKHALLRLEMDDDKLRELVVHCSSMMRK